MFANNDAIVECKMTTCETCKKINVNKENPPLAVSAKGGFLVFLMMLLQKLSYCVAKAILLCCKSYLIKLQKH